jgi:hypothetical protein
MTPVETALAATSIALQAMALAIQQSTRSSPPETRDIRDALVSIREAEDYYRMARGAIDTVSGEDIGVDPLNPIPRGDIALDYEIWSRQIRSDIGASRAALTTLRTELEAVLRGRGQIEVVVYGDISIQEIAQQYLGDWTQWHVIASANDLAPNAVLSPGDVLIIPRTV